MDSDLVKKTCRNRNKSEPFHGFIYFLVQFEAIKGWAHCRKEFSTTLKGRAHCVMNEL